MCGWLVGSGAGSPPLSERKVDDEKKGGRGGGQPPALDENFVKGYRWEMGYREDWFAENKSDHGWYTCAKCGKKIRKSEVDIDHIIPQKYTKIDHVGNLQCLCKHCNRSKQARVDLKETTTDLIKANSKRVVKSVKFAVKTVAKKVLKKK